MKFTSMFLGLLVVSANSFAAPVKVAMPDSLQCKAVQQVYGNPDKSNLQDYQSIQITAINSKNDMKWDDGYGIVGTNDDKVILDFGVGANGGDQYSTFTFLKDDVDALLAGKQATLSGLYEDAFDWADGYHTRGEFVVICTK